MSDNENCSNERKALCDIKHEYLKKEFERIDEKQDKLEMILNDQITSIRKIILGNGEMGLQGKVQDILNKVNDLNDFRNEIKWWFRGSLMLCIGSLITLFVDWFKS